MESRLDIKLGKGRVYPSTSGGFSFIGKGKRDARATTARYLTNLRKELVKDLGGEKNLSVVQVVLIDRLLQHLEIVRAQEEDARQAKKGIKALSKTHRAYSGLISRTLMALSSDLKPKREILGPLGMD